MTPSPDESIYSYPNLKETISFKFTKCTSYYPNGLSFSTFMYVSVYVYASVCDFVCIALFLPFVLRFCLSVFVCLVGFFSTVFSSCYHWWICFLVWMLSSLFLFLLLKNFF